MLDRAREKKIAAQYFEQLQVKAASLEAPVNSLSGGNQQKIVLAKWLARDGRLLIVDEPTRGVDVGAKAAIHALIDDLARQGLAVMLISSELPEVINLSTRILVMREGAIAGELSRDQASQDAVLRLMAGVTARAACLLDKIPAEMSGQFVVMGVSGSGKTSVARMLAERTGGLFLDADDFHSPENKAKMASGIPLTDEDRWPWLGALNAELKGVMAGGRLVFLACSALRQVDRDRLSAGLPALQFIYLKGSEELIRSRLQSRVNHFMPAALLDSQFATLEEPAQAIIAPIEDSLAVIVDKLLPQIETATVRRDS
jgi:carbohydrate kinase (thermoresistant glucokinase family)